MKDAIIVKFSNGKIYKIPTIVIAEDRARYYASIDGYDEDSQEFLDEVNVALSDEFIIFDWIKNNMKWNRLKEYIESVEDFDPIDIEQEFNKIDLSIEGA